MKTRNILAAAFVAVALGACGPDLDASNTIGELETQDPATQPEVLFYGIDVEDPSKSVNLPRQIDRGAMNPTLLGREAMRSPDLQVPVLRRIDLDAEQVPMPQ